MSRHPWLRPPDELVDQRAPSTPRQTFRRALFAGFTADQASTLAAWRAGIHIDEAPGPWSLHTLAHLLFLRDQVDRGRLGGDRDSSRRAGA